MHRAYSARAVVAHVLSQRSLSPPEQSNQPISPSRVPASARAASGATASEAERPLPEQGHSIALRAAAADSRNTGAKAAAEKPHVKRKLLNGMHTGSTSPQLVGKTANWYPVSQNGAAAAAADTQQSLSQIKPSKPFVAADSFTKLQTDVAGSLRTAQLVAENDSAGPSASLETDHAASQKQQQQQQEPQQQHDKGTEQVNGMAAPTAGPGGLKAFLNGLRPNLATWDDVDPDLAKEHAALNRCATVCAVVNNRICQNAAVLSQCRCSPAIYNQLVSYCLYPLYMVPYLNQH